MGKEMRKNLSILSKKIRSENDKNDFYSCLCLNCYEYSNEEIYYMSNVRCQMLDVKCRMSNVRCQISDVKCQMLDVRCQMSDVRCQMSNVRCYMWDDGCHICWIHLQYSSASCCIVTAWLNCKKEGLKLKPKLKQI